MHTLTKTSGAAECISSLILSFYGRKEYFFDERGGEVFGEYAHMGETIVIC